MTKRTFIIVLVVLLTTAAGFGQSSQYTKGTADQSLRSNGRVNPSTLGLEIDVPLGSYPGRGINLPLSLSYSSKQWRLAEEQCGSTAQGMSQTWAVPRFSENAAAGWTTSLSQPYIEYTGEMYRFQDDGEPLRAGETGCVAEPWRAGDSYIKRITVYVSGSSHEMIAQDEPIALTVGQVPAESVWNATFYATDGSGLKYVQDSGSGIYRLYMPDGSFYDFNSTREYKSTTDFVMVRRANRITDVHGNFVEFLLPNPSIPAELIAYPNGYWQDQLNRKFPVMVPRHNPTLPQNESVLEQSFTMPGMEEPYILKWKQLKGTSAETSALTNYSQELHYPGAWSLFGSTATNSPALFSHEFDTSCGSSAVYAITYNPAGQKFNPVVLTDIILPNGAAYKFTYNHFGEIEAIQYPTGGREEVDYAEVPALAELTGLYKKVNRGVVKRDVYESDADQTEDTWLYSAGVSANNYRTSVVAPDDTQTDRYMHRGVPPNCVQNPDPPAYFGTRWGHDNVLAGMQYDERVFNSAGSIVQRQVTRWAATTTTTRLNQSKYVQRNARVLTTESITYDGNVGLSAATKNEYDTDENTLGSPQNVVRTTQYAFTAVSNGSSFAPAASTDAPPSAVPSLTDPTGSATAVRIIDTVYLQSDPAYSTVKDQYLARNVLKLATKVLTKNGAGTTIAAQSEIKYDEPGYSNPNQANAYRGQPTTVRSWLDTNSSWIETHTKYDAFGNAIESTDAKGSTSTTTYDSTYSAFPVSVTSPIPSDGTHGSSSAFVTTTTYNPVTGQPLTVTDPNGLKTKMEYEDPMLRPTRVAAYNSSDQQVGAATETSYGAGTDVSTTRWVKTRSQIDATNWKEGYSWYDGLGRTIRSQSVDSNGDVFVLKCYDEMGRASKASNPFRGYTTQDCTTTTGMEWTENTFDTAGRPWKTTTPDGAIVKTTYSVAVTGGNLGTTITVEDQAGKLRRSITNALGQLTRVDEPSGGGLGAMDAPNQATFYTYDFLNNLTAVQQEGDTSEECGAGTTPCSQARGFQYDSLSRLKQATNPESGTISYTYDANGNLQTKVDARTITTTYAYDALNRVKTRVYTGVPTGSETPNVSYYYDLVANAKGKLIKVTNGTGADHSTTEYVTFDILGRVTRSKQTTDGVVFGDDTNPMTYSYNLSGALIEQKYPSGRVVKNILDTDGALATVQSKKNQNHAYWNYANHFLYSAAGALTSMQLGNGRWESAQFNSRLQPTQIALGSVQNATDKLKLDYQYGDLDSSGNIISGSNNGNVAKQTITVASVGATPGFTALQNYDYDSLNRIQIASETLTPTTGSPETWVQDFRYDRYGNRTFYEPTTTTLPKNCGTAPNLTVCTADVPKVNPSANPTNNKLNGYTFDAAGNTTRDAESRKFIYDAENKQIKVQTVDGSGSPTGTVGEYFYDGDGKRIKKRAYTNNVLTEETIFVYDASGMLVAEYSDTVASTQDAKAVYLTNDHLGSPRVNTDFNGNVISRHDYHPFGDEIKSDVTPKRAVGIGYADDAVRKQFTGYDRDHETELGYAQARYYAGNLGRFTSADALYIASSRVADPQRINLYVYARNNPLNAVDPTGLDVKIVDKTEDGNGDDELLGKANSRKDGKFRLAYDSKNRLQIVDSGGKAIKGNALRNLGKGLSGGEHALFEAVTNRDSHATINVVRGDANVDFGDFGGRGTNTVDIQDMNLLDAESNRGGLSASQAISHELVEAFASAGNPSLTEGQAHARANEAFGGLMRSRDGKGAYGMDEQRNLIEYGEYSPVYGRTDSTAKIHWQLKTPIPKASLPLKELPPAHITYVKNCGSSTEGC